MGLHDAEEMFEAAKEQAIIDERKIAEQAAEIEALSAAVDDRLTRPERYMLRHLVGFHLEENDGHAPYDVTDLRRLYEKLSR